MAGGGRDAENGAAVLRHLPPQIEGGESRRVVRRWWWQLGSPGDGREQWGGGGVFSAVKSAALLGVEEEGEEEMAGKGARATSRSGFIAEWERLRGSGDVAPAPVPLLALGGRQRRMAPVRAQDATWAAR